MKYSTLQLVVTNQNRIYCGAVHTDYVHAFNPGEEICRKIEYKINENIATYLEAKENDFVSEFFKMIAYRIIRALGMEKRYRYVAFIKTVKQEQPTVWQNLNAMVDELFSKIRNFVNRKAKQIRKEKRAISVERLGKLEPKNY